MLQCHSSDSGQSPGSSLSHTGKPTMGYITPGVASPMLSRWQESPLITYLQYYFECRPNTVSILCSRGTFLAPVCLVSTRTPRFISAELLYCGPSASWCLGLFTHRCRTFHFSLLNFRRFLSISPAC